MILAMWKWLREPSRRLEEGLQTVTSTWEIVKNANLYIMILGYYDIMINMDWWESHDAILNGKMKRLS
jgi:hypothetical protein